MKTLTDKLELLKQHMRDTCANRCSRWLVEEEGHALNECRVSDTLVFLVQDNGYRMILLSEAFGFEVVEQYHHDHGFETTFTKGTERSVDRLLEFLEL